MIVMITVVVAIMTMVIVLLYMSHFSGYAIELTEASSDDYDAQILSAQILSVRSPTVCTVALA